MKRGSRISRKPAAPVLADPRPVTRFQSRNNSLPQLHAEETSEVDPETAFLLNRTATIEGFAGVRPGSRQGKPVLYAGKLRANGGNMGKTGFRPIGSRSNTHIDTSDLLLVPKKHKRGHPGAHQEAESVSLLSKSVAGPSHHSPQPIFRLHPYKPLVRSATPELKSAFIDLEEVKEALLKALEAVERADLRGQLRVYHVYFGETLKASGGLKGILEVFQRGYEGLVEELQEKYTCEVSKLQGEIINLQSGILREADERKNLLSRIEKLSHENVEMTETCQSYEEKLTDYQEKLYDIANVRMDLYPPSQQAWRVLNSELEYYHGWKRNAERELKLLKSKEKKLVRLVHALKEQGYPVEEVYNAQVKTPAPSAHSEEICRDENESQRLVSGRPKSLPKPEKVPSLRLDEVEPDVSSEEISAEVVSAEMSLGRTISGLSTHFMTDEMSPIGRDSSDHRKIA